MPRLKNIDVLEVGGKLGEIQVGRVIVAEQSEMDVGLTAVAMLRPGDTSCTHHLDEVVGE